MTPHLIFLLSPANLAGKRGALVFRPDAQFEIARQFQSPAGIPIADLYSFVSGLYFRRVRAWAEVDIDARNVSYTAPLVRAAEALERAYGATTRFVLLGSVATDKYVRPLARVFGDHLRHGRRAPALSPG